MMGAASSSPSPADRIGHYRILQELGQGSMGVVFRAYDEEQNREVALKTIATEMRGNPELRKRFYLEADVARKLDHPGIIHVLEVGEAGGHMFIAMELLDGQDLKTLIKHGPQTSLEQRIDWMRQLTAAIGYAHSKGIIHRDVKPGNIHIRSNGKAVVMDFGIARTADSRITTRGAILGTPEYISPEQVLAIRVDHRADIFSLGLVFYELLTGAHPFRSKNLPSTVHRILNESPPSPEQLNPAIPIGLAAIVLKMLEKDLNARYQSCARILADLEEF